MQEESREGTAFLVTEPPGRGQRRLALAVVLASLLFFLAALPFAQRPLPPVWPFIPIYQSALVVNDLITATLLFGQFHILRWRALLVLAAGYLFTAFMAVAHALSFPGLFAPGGLLGAGPQTTAWLYMFWHGGFPLFVIAYARRKDSRACGGSAAAVPACIAAVALAAVAATLVATAGKALLPAIMDGNRYTPAMILVVSSVWGASLVALVVLWRSRPHSVLDLWLMVVMGAWLCDIALSAVLNGGRFDLGFYAGRIYGLLAASIVLMVLLLENGRLYARLAGSHARERAKSAELARLSAELETINDTLAERNRELQAASTRKSEFLANMSHELRTPLNAIIGFSDVLKDGMVGPLPAQQREYIGDINQSGRHLLALINDILDLSKVEAGRMSLDLEAVELGALLDSCLSIVREKAGRHRIELLQRCDGVEAGLLADPRKLKQIVYNLLSNAVKFTPDGGRVELRARRVGRAAVTGWHSTRPAHVLLPLPEGGCGPCDEFLEIAVEDSGMGIAAADAQSLFQPFSQIDASLARRHEGTGLGLAMVLRLAQLHGGTAALESEPGHGSCFLVWLPWRRVGPLAQDVPGAAAGDDDGRPLVLVVEDDRAAAELLRLYLEDEGFQVGIVGDAAAAEHFLGTHDPCLIVLDVLLPGVDGWSLLARLKRSGSPWAALPVVVVSIVADAGKGQALGAAQVLQKPLGREELAGAIARLGLRGQARGAPRPPQPGAAG